MFLNEVSSLYKFINTDNLIQKIISSFHDYDNLYFVSKFYEGFVMNHLSYSWSEKQIQFFSACLIESFIHLRNEKLIHRDIHLYNLVFDERQYINLIDFHIVMKYDFKNEPKGYVIGSPDLCAPEMINRLEYDYNSDYYRLGSMIYYIIFKKYPNRIMKKKKKIKQIKIGNNEAKEYSLSCIDFINKLMIVDKKKRIGYNNINEIMNHSFFIGFNWEKFFNKSMISPFPKITRSSLNLCNKKSLPKKINIDSNLAKNETFRNKVFAYDNFNARIIDKIINNLKNKNI